MDKWEYITKISHASDKTGNLLIELMDECHCTNLQQIPEDKAKEFYERRILKHEQMAWNRKIDKRS